MFRQQKIILKSVSPLCAVLSRYTWQSEPAHSLALAEESSRQFRDSLPQFGAFSSGQSSILNALLGESLFSVKNKGADPEVVLRTTPFTGLEPAGYTADHGERSDSFGFTVLGPEELRKAIVEKLAQALATYRTVP